MRFGFRLDYSALVNFSGLQYVQVFSASAPTTVGGFSHVLDIALSVPTLGSPPHTLTFTAARGSGGPSSTPVAFTQTSNVVRVEINVGANTAGNVRYWINHAFTDPPDGTIDDAGAGLDTAAFQGVIAATVGLGSQSGPFRSAQTGNALVFDQIESSDDVLFYDDFSSGAQ